MLQDEVDRLFREERPTRKKKKAKGPGSWREISKLRELEEQVNQLNREMRLLRESWRSPW